MCSAELTADGGIFTRARALSAGVPVTELNRMLRTETIAVVRSGWYAVAGADPVVERAVKAGGVLSCVSALSRYPGVWIPPGDALHVRRSGYSRRAVKMSVGDQSKPPATARGCCAFRELAAPTRAVDPLGIALACAARCVSEEYLVAILDSVLRLGLATRSDLVEVLEGAPIRITRLLDELDELAGSGTESLVRFRLRRLGFRVKSQQFFEGVGWVDLLVGDSMIIECDSKSHHLGAQYHTDRSRDLVSLVGCRITVRLTYEQVLFGWETVEPQLLALLRRRIHLSAKNRQLRPSTHRADGRETA